MPSTPSSTSAPGDAPARRASPAAIATLVLLSLAIPAGALALILADRHPGSPVAGAAPSTTVVAPTDAHKARVGTLAPDFTLPRVGGGRLTLSALRGRPVVVVFFASWCHPCEEELPVLERIARDERGRLRVVGVSFQDLASDSVAFVRRLHVTFPAGLDTPDSPVAASYGVRGIPQTVFVDARGVVRGRVYGQTSRASLLPAIGDLLHGRSVRSV